MPKGQSKKDNPEKLAAQGTQDEEKNRETVNIGYTRRRKEQKLATKTKTNEVSLGNIDEEKQSVSW